MGQVWTRDDWNQLIRDVNQVLQNPPASTSCGPIDPLDEAFAPPPPPPRSQPVDASVVAAPEGAC